MPSFPPTLLTGQRTVGAAQLPSLADLSEQPKPACVRGYAVRLILSNLQPDRPKFAAHAHAWLLACPFVRVAS